MATIKKLYFADGTDTTAPTDLSFEASTNHLEVYVDDAAYVTANGTATSGDIYLNSTLNAPRAYLNSAWRTGVMTNAGADATKAFAVSTSGATTSTTSTLAFTGTVSRTFTFPDLAGTIVLTTGTQAVDGKTFTAATLTNPLITTGGGIDVTAAGSLTIGASIGANNLTLGGASTTVVIAGDLTVNGTNTILNTSTVESEDKNILVNKGGNDAASEGAGIEVDRTGTHGSLKYEAALASKWKLGALGAEVEVVTVSAAQALSNKDYQGGVASNTNRLVLPNASLATLNTLTNVEGAIAYATDTDALYTNDGVAWNAITGGGGGSSTVTVTQASHGFTTSNIGAPLYISTGGVYTLCKADAANTAEVQGLISSINNVNSFILLIGDGVITVDTAVSGGGALVVGSTYFVSAATAGQITATEPTTTIGNVSKPLGTATSTTVLQYQPGLRGIVVGGTNALTSLALPNNAVTTVQSLSVYQAAEMTGYISLVGTASQKFYFSAQVSKNAAGTDFNLSWQYSGETPVVGFNITVTTGGLVQVTLPSIAGYVSGTITYSLNAPAVGATFPLSISAAAVLGATTGVAVAAGYIGQKIQATISLGAGYAFVASESDLTGFSITLPPGIWGIKLTLAIENVALAGVYCKITDSSNVQVGDSLTRSYGASIVRSVTSIEYVNISATTTYKARGYAPSLNATLYNDTTQGNSSFQAIRIA